MEVYLITLSKWAKKLVPSGYAARWNSNGVNMIYTASSRALACLENIVHVNKIDNSDKFKMVVINIPDKLSSLNIKDSDLARGWDKFDERAYNICRIVGDKWAKDNSSVILKVPSAIVKEEGNILINVNHPEFSKIKIVDIQSFFFDPRIKT